jgi:hypothetical protein
VQAVRLAVNVILDGSASSRWEPHDCSPFLVQSSDTGTYVHESVIVGCCTVTHRLVDALWPSRGAACQSTIPHPSLPVIMQGELSMAEWQGGIPVEDSSRAMDQCWIVIS